MQLVRAALRNPYLVSVLVLILLVLGTVSVLELPADLLPIYKTPAIQILTLYPGMPPEVVERDMTSRLERWTGQSVGIEHQEATSMLGVSIVRDFFREDIDPDTAMAQVTSLAVSDMFYLPPGTLPPMVMPFDPTASVPLCLLSVHSPTLTEKELYDVAYYEMRNRLQSISGVIAPAVYGGVLRRILAYVDRDRLESRNLSPMDVVEAIQRSNPFVPIGSMRMGDYEYFVVSNAMVKEVAELNDIPIRVDEGAPVFIRDVGEARDTHQIQTNIVRINGRRQVYIPIYRQPGANTLEVVDEVKERSDLILQRIKEFNPKAADLGMDVVMDQSAYVRGSINSLLWSAIVGGLLVTLVVFWFLRSAGATALVVVTVPLALFGAFIGLFYTGDTINAMTLGGLSLSIGILVDQAIVVVENIRRHLAMGKSRMQAALDGGREVATPVVIATVTFIVVFYPVVFLSGMARFLFTPLALAVSFAAVVSCLLALTFIPAMASRFFSETSGEGPRESGEVGELASRYGEWVRGSLAKRTAIIGIAGLLFLVALVGTPLLGTELFPPVDAGQFTVLMRAPLGTSLEANERLVERVETRIQEVIGAADPDLDDPESELRLLISNIGVLYDWPAAYTPNTGPMDAFILVQLKDNRSRSAQDRARELRAALSETFPDVDFAFDTGGMLTAALNFGLPSPIDIQVQGSDLKSLHRIAAAIAEEARGVPGAVDVRVGQPLDFPAIELQVDRTRAAYLGLTQQEIIENVAAAINSSVNFSPSFWIAPNGNHYLIGAQYAEEKIETLETLENIPITGKDTVRTVLLKDIARLRWTEEPAVVTHRNITRTVDVFVNVDGRDVGSVAAEIEGRLESSPRMERIMEGEEGLASKGYTITMRGEVKSMRDSLGQFAFGLLIAAVLVYLVMVAQFRSFALPFVVILTVPLAFFGVVAVMLLTGTNLGIPSFMGLILMTGIVVEYSILLVEFAARRQREGAAIEDAVVSAARARFRPVIMTALTTALALLPLALGIGRGSEANVPLARAIIGAVIGGAALTLLVTPSLYMAIARKLRLERSPETA